MIYRVLVESKVGPHGRMCGPVYGPVLRKKSIQRYAIFFFADHSFLQRTTSSSSSRSSWPDAIQWRIVRRPIPNLLASALFDTRSISSEFP